MQVLRAFRDEIDAIDTQLIVLLASRYEVVRRVAEVKREQGIEPYLPDRVQEVLDLVAGRASAVGLEPEIAKRVWTTIIDEACSLEHRLIDSPT